MHTNDTIQSFNWNLYSFSLSIKTLPSLHSSRSHCLSSPTTISHCTFHSSLEVPSLSTSSDTCSFWRLCKGASSSSISEVKLCLQNVRQIHMIDSSKSCKLWTLTGAMLNMTINSAWQGYTPRLQIYTLTLIPWYPCLWSGWRVHISGSGVYRGTVPLQGYEQR